MNSLFSTYPEVILYCIQNIGNEIYTKGDRDLVAWYIQNIISLGFQYPQITGATDEWQVKLNRSHIKNIRVWLELIENNPKWSLSLISSLIVHLSLGGIHISDTDLFQKDITNLLNSDIEPVYCHIKQLAQLFPVYFFDIGAEGELREVSTELDEIAGRRDHIIHFIRKQSHVESSAHVVDFMEEVILYWKTKDKTPLKGFLPEDMYDRIVPSGPYVDELRTIFTSLFTKEGIQKVTDLLKINKEDFKTIVKDISGISERELERARIAIRFYQLLYQKYRFNILDIKNTVKQAQSLGLPNTDALINMIEHGTVYERLQTTLEYLKRLKDIILSPEHFEPVENIFRKRHISAGIPSMYGNYHERKFDALTFTFRLEHYANILFEDIVSSFHPKYITRATLFKINTIMHLFSDALKQNGIFSDRLDNTLELLSSALEVRRFSFSQYIDIFKSFSESVQSIVNTHYTGLHKNNLKHIIRTIGIENMLPKYLKDYRAQRDMNFLNKVSEQFLRGIVASSFGLQQLDNFISNMLKTLREQEKEADSDSLSLLMSYDAEKTLCSILNPDQLLHDRIYIGNKGYNLLRMSSLGLPVPPGFIITTEVFRCLGAINRFQYTKDHLAKKIKENITKLEVATGKELGNPENPLLVSVRSGGAISMPGMMNSLLNVGINESIVKGLIKQTGNPWYAWDCYRRFLQSWGMSFGTERDTFDSLIDTFKKKYGTFHKSQFTPDQMKEVAFAYRDAVEDMGIKTDDDPESQLYTVISQVFASWFSQKAQKYRDIMGISEHWGTAVIVQAMVYGNLDHNAGSGVIFTRKPHESDDSVVLWGDFAVANQGDDIVSGLVKTLPISNEQRTAEGRITDNSLQDSFPEIYNELQRFVHDLLYRQKWSAQEIEFTFEGTEKHNLYILQSREMTITKQESLEAFVPSQELSEQYLSSGIGVGGGALSGKAVFNLDEIHRFREKDPSLPLILIRSDTVPDDIMLISSVDGLLTSRGGSTSHAAIIANRLGKTCVVGCNYLIVMEHEKRCTINDQTIKTGNFLSIDGRSGSVYSGKHPVQEITIVE
jgi:pyruvate,orthophosphate dikinase